MTPTFIIFRNGEKVHQHGGINETNLHRVRACCLPLVAALAGWIGWLGCSPDAAAAAGSSSSVLLPSQAQKLSHCPSAVLTRRDPSRCPSVAVHR